MTEPNQPLFQPEPSTDSQTDTEEEELPCPEVSQEPVSQLRRSKRVKTLTVKGKEMQDEKIKGLQQRFNYIFEKWRICAKSSKQPLSQSEPLSEDLLNDIVGDVTGLSVDTQRAYNELRQVTTPDSETRRKVDICVQISKFIVSKAEGYMQGKIAEEEQDWPDVGSLFESTVCKSHTSDRSSNSSVKHQEAAAEAAASQAVLKVLEEQEIEQIEIDRLEAEVRRKAVEQEALVKKLRLERETEELKLRTQREEDEARIKAKQEEEYAALQRSLDERKRRLQHLEKVKDLRAAQARMQVYDQMSVTEEHNVGITRIITESKALGQVQVSVPPQQEHLFPQAATTPLNDSTAELVKLLAGALNASRIPIPEPSMFSGDPLRYNDWKLSFHTLIDQKNIPENEKIFYLRRYVSGQAKSALDGYFLLGTESAYAAAWKVLDERYGNPFSIAKAYRDKLQTWPKISSKDSIALRDFTDFLRSCEAAMVQIKSLEILNDCNENRNILSKLPDWITACWNRKVTEIEEETNQFPTFSQFVSFLTREAKIACNPVTSLQSLKQREADSLEKFKLPRQRNIGVKTLATTSQEKTAFTCLFCKKTKHTLPKCRRFLEKAVTERVKFIQGEKLCFGCLKPGHYSKSCSNRKVCERCNKGHPTCLHEERSKEEQKTPQDETNSSNERPSQKNQAQTEQLIAIATTNRVIRQKGNMQTAAIIPVWLSSKLQPSQEILTYALLDTQSDTTFVLSEVAGTLDVIKEPVKLELSTMTSKTTVIQSQRLKGLQVRGFYSNQRISLPSTFTREFIPANQDHIPTSETAKAWSHLKHLQAEIAPLQECVVGLLIGYNCSQALLPREIVSGKDDEPYAQRTDLGWSIVGQSNPCLNYGDAIGVSHRIIVRKVIPDLSPSNDLLSEVYYVNRTKVRDVTPSEIIKALELDFSEKASDDNHVSQDDLKFLTQLREGIKLNESSHYEMPLPFRDKRPKLPNNKVSASHRLMCLERRLRKDKAYYNDYSKFMDDIISRGDAEKIPEEQLDNSPAWYIPHHGVYHPHKPGKIRIVFDCSAKYQDTSLNDHLLTGPDLTNTLVGVLCRFRKGSVAFTCDIERMFHQFHVKREDQDYLRFLWWEQGNLDTTPSVYRMKVHLFGAASSPGCANFGLKHLAAQGQGRFKENVIRFIQKNFYVDDGLASVSTESEAIQLVRDSRELCATGKLRLHKFVSNSERVMTTIPEEERATVKDLDMSLSLPQIERALGVEWCITSDTFKFRVQVKANALTRRGVLSTVASIYDPLGFIAPFVLLGKQILQQMCQDKLDWDEGLPEHLKPRWESWIQDLPRLANVQIKRCFIPPEFGQIRSYELHHFADASVSGYGECTYLRVTNQQDEVHCCLLMGKSRVTPKRVLTIPRLELSAAVVAVRVSDLLRAELEIQDLQEFFWTDSTVVLGYINNDARRFQVFVANRVQRIKYSTTAEQWAYIASEDNPADHASRGSTAEQLKSSNWFTGPKFLWKKGLPERNIVVGEIKGDDPELRKAFVCNINAKEEGTLLDRFEKFSDWSRLVRALAALKRKIKEYKGLTQSTKDSTSLEERKEAELLIIKLVQAKAFSNEIQTLKTKKAVAKTKNCKLYKLNPFLDDEGILRVGGRLSHAALHPHVKHPAIIPKDSHVSILLIRHFHAKIQHQGRGMTTNELRANGWWILGCSSAVSSHIFKCVKCRKYRRSTEVQKMGDLPSDRTEPTPPFTYVGMDCFGPIYVKDGRRELKRYGLVLTCLCSRAVHIEVVDDLSTDSFMNALRAFIAIRGNVRQLRCDKGTNFVGAQREFANLMKDMDQERIKAFGCEFLMNPPSASHMGGVWERQIRTIRSVLSAVLDQSAKRLDPTSLRTFLYEVMAIINSRPLSAEHLNDPTGPEPLTPNHILTMKSTIVQPPPGQFLKEDLFLQRRWRRVQYLVNEFWTRWRKEYLLNLQPRQKWQALRRDLKVNDIVLLQDDLAPRNEWRIARVTDVYPGADNKVRKVRLLVGVNTLDKHCKHTTKAVSLDRPVHKVIVLLEAE
ncbi:uncharacterized protein LOC128533064 [Clarias gariepinus]|uniref:uncharacterized protein LOC128533064 n=1 Tax=Clarias gariepinus TaxID=13013 RepID=UPI00234D9DBA|nr:uncharacterized protein LOC128533064 [Clarias gariepinus]